MVECQIDWNLVFNGIQSLAAIVAVFGGLRYLSNHHKKLKIERRNIALENALRELIKTDQLFTLFFTDLGVKNDPEFKKRIKEVKEKIENKSQQELEWISNMILSYEIFLFNRDKFFYDLMTAEKQILVEISLSKDIELEKAFHDFDNAMAEIFEFMNDFLPDILFLEPLDREKVIKFFENKKSEFPFDLNDKNNLLVKKYLDTGGELKKMLLSLL